MKNLPDNEFFDKLKDRLQNLEDQPDDDTWNTIAANISTAEPGWIRKAERSSLALTLLMFLGVTYWVSLATTNQQAGETGDGLAAHMPAVESTGRSATTDAQVLRQSATNLPVPGSRAVPSDSAQHSSSGSPAEGALPEHLATKSASTPTAAGKHGVPSDEAALFRSRASAARASERYGHNGITGQSDTNVPEPTGIAADANSPTAGDRQTVMGSVISFNDGATSDSSLVQVVEAEPIGKTAATTKQDSIAFSIVLPARRATKQKSAMRIYATATPALTFVDVNPSDSDDATFQALNSPGILSKDRLSFSFEAGTQFALGRRLMAFAGLTYFQQSMDLSLEQIENGSAGFSSNGTLDFNFQPQTITTTVHYRQQNVGITTGLAYVISMGKITHELGGSFQYEYGLLQRSSERNGQSNNFLNYRIFYRAGYDLNERLSLFIQPSFVRSLLYQDVLDGAIRVKQSRAGVGIGVVYKLGIRN